MSNIKTLLDSGIDPSQIFVLSEESLAELIKEIFKSVNERISKKIIAVFGDSPETISILVDELNEKVNNIGTPIGIESIVQTTSSEESSGENIWLITLTDGTISELKILNGKQGDPGKSATIVIGSVTEGDTPAVTNSGTEQDAVLDFVIPAKETIIEKTVKIAEKKQVYSSEETVIGTWLDVPLFRRVFTGNIADGLKLTETGNIDKLVHQYGSYGINSRPMPYQLSESEYCILMKVDNDISITAVGNSIGTAFDIVAEYTKAVAGDNKIGYFNLDAIGYTGEDNEDLVIPKLFVAEDGNVYNVTKIDNGMFNDAANLASVTIPETVTEIGGYAFQNCTNLRKVDVSEGTTTIGRYTFQKCSNLTEVNLPTTITAIDNYTFQYCESLESIIIPDGVTSINSWSFQYCKNLKEITLPASLSKIDSFAFQYCENLTTVNYKGTEEQWKAITISMKNDYVKNATINYNYS